MFMFGSVVLFCFVFVLLLFGFRHQEREEVLMVLLAWSRQAPEPLYADAGESTPEGSPPAGDGAPATAAHIVSLDDVDTENPLLEGAKFSDPTVTANLATPLHVVDQALMLEWAADVKDHNPMVRPW